MKITRFVKSDRGYEIYTKNFEDVFFPMITVTIYDDDIQITYCNSYYKDFRSGEKKNQILDDLETAYREYRKMMDVNDSSLDNSLFLQKPTNLQEAC